MGEVLGESHGAATIGGRGPRPARTDPRSGEPAFRARQVWRWAANGAQGYEEMTDLPGRAARARWPRRSRSRTLHADPRGARLRRHGQGALPHPRRPRRRGRADALPRRPPLVCVSSQSGCPLTCTFCATGDDEVRPQPDRVRDPRPGAALPPHRAGRPPRVHGHGRADDEPRPRARRRAPAARHRHHPPPHRHLHRRLGPRHRAS